MHLTIKELSRCEDELHEVARHKTGFVEFGDPVYREGLRVLLEAFDRELQLTETGRQATFQEIVCALSGRLYAHKGWRDHPEVLTVPIRQPLVIAGFPRSGTTALQRLLSMDPQLQGLEFWLERTPMIRPPRETWDAYPEYRSLVASLEGGYAGTPELRSAHESVAGEVESCLHVLLQSFATPAWSFASALPTYDKWLLTKSPLDTYKYYANVLRLIGARDPQRRWLLKTPFHMLGIDTLLEVFPDACIIQTHRDPLKVIPSICSVLSLGKKPEHERRPSSIDGPRMCEYWRKAQEHMQVVATDFPRQFFHVDHRHFLQDPLGTARSIYEYFGITLTLDAEQRMRKWIKMNPTNKHGEHKYALDSWGITPHQICESFADYRERYRFTDPPVH